MTTTVTASDNDAVNKLSAQYNLCRNYFRPIRESWTKYYKQYRGILDIDSSKEYYRWRSKLFIPATARAVDGLLPDELLILFGANPFFAVLPREAGDVDNAKIQEALLSFDFDNCDFFNKTHVFLKQLALYGNSIAKVFWKKEVYKNKKQLMVPNSAGDFAPQNYIEEEVVIDQPWIEPIDIFNLVWSPKATSLSDTYIYQRTEKTIREMKQSVQYKNLDQLEYCIAEDKASGVYEEEIRKESKGLSPAYSSEEGDDRRVELLEYWNIDRTKTCTLAGQRVYVKEMRDNPFGYKYDPFVMAQMWPMPFEILGEGIPQKVRDIQSQINSEVNQRLDNRNIRMNLTLKVRRGANINTRNLGSKPGAVWLTDDMTALEVVNFPDVTSSNSFAEENMLEAKCEEITGVTRYAIGSGNDSRRTATEASILTRMASKAFALHVKNIEEQYILPVIRKFMFLNSKFMEKEQVVRVMGIDGNKFQKVMPLDVSSINYDLIAQGSSQLTDKNLKVQQMINYMGLIANDPQMAPFKHFIHKKIWELWGNRDFDSIMRTAQVPPAGVPGMPLPGQPGGINVPQGAGNVPVEPTGIRMPSGMEGNSPMMMGGGGNQIGGGY